MSGSLKFSGAVDHPRGADFKCLATIEAGDEIHQVILEMIAVYQDDLLGFFEDIGETAARGWDGEQKWRSEFQELTVRATSAGDGTVTFDVLIEWPPSYDERWEGTLVFAADAVERFASRMREFMGLEHGSRFLIDRWRDS